MTLVAAYRRAQRDHEVARVRRVVALRAMQATGMSQRQIAAALGVTQPAVSQQLRHAPDLRAVHPEIVVEAAAPILRVVAADHGYRQLAVFGSAARGDARPDSDIDLLVEAPEGASSFDFVRFQQLIEEIVGRPIDLVEYGGLDRRLDEDIRREAVLL